MSFSNTRIVKASRKRSQCFWCNELIEVGHPKVNHSWFYDGLNQANFHPECDAANTQWWRENKNAELEDGPVGIMKRGSVEER